MQLFYNPNISENTQTFAFDREESRHIVKVLRKSGGDNVFVSNGKGIIFKTEITSAAEHKCVVKITGQDKYEQPVYNVHLAVAPTKMNDRYEWFLEKATELGATHITPLICERSERKILKTDRLHKIVQSAAKQSLRAWLPQLNEPVNFRDFVTSARDGIRIIAHCEESNRQPLKSIIKPGIDATVAIGPEGDFTPAEITIALENGFIPATLGQNRLRTETAAIAACHAISFINEKP